MRARPSHTATEIRPFLFGLLLAAACLAPRQGAAVTTPTALPFSRYQVILDRMPFGEPPPPPRPAAVPPPSTTPPKNAFINDLRMCAITENSRGIRVGLVDVKSKPQKSYFLRIGETQDDLQLVEADYEGEGALLKKGNEQYWIYMSGDPQAASPTGQASSSPSPSRPAPSSTSRRRSAVRRASYAERLAQRRADEVEARRRAAMKERLSGEELVDKLKEYQMDVIRKGMPALPIPLTREMDDKLVLEGVLPPIE